MACLVNCCLYLYHWKIRLNYHVFETETILFSPHDSFRHVPDARKYLKPHHTRNCSIIENALNASLFDFNFIIISRIGFLLPCYNVKYLFIWIFFSHHVFSSPTSAKGSKFEVLSNVKGQMSSWIGSVQVPSVPNLFNKGGDAQNPEATGETKVDSPTSGESVKGSPEHKDEDDNSRYRYISLLCVLARLSWRNHTFSCVYHIQFSRHFVQSL